MIMKNIVVLVSGGGTNLQALIDAQESGIIAQGKITCVISSKPGVFALERAKKHNIKTRVIARKEYSDSIEYSKAILAALNEEKADLVIYAGFMTILDELVVKAYPNKMMNVHPALIPSFCGKGYYGLRVHEEVLKKEGLFVQDEKTGLSKPHPLAKWQDALRYTLKGYLTELGFTPASRSKVNIQPKESDTNEFLKL